MFPNGSVVTIVRRTVTGTDQFGNDVYTSVSEDVTPCSVQPTSSRENLAFTDQLTNGVIVFVPFGTEIDYLDAIIVDGIQYEVNGKPDTWTSPFSGSVAPIRIEGTKVTGASP